MYQTQHIHAYIDESGDAGFKFRKGSSRYFAMVAVIFRDPAVINQVDQAIADLRKKLGFRKNKEFKFNNDPQKVCEAFCRAVRDFDFSISVVVVDKTQITDHALMKSSKEFYRFVAKLLLKHSLAGLTQVKISFDGIVMTDMKQSLRAELNTAAHVVATVNFLDSTKSSLIQLADMVVSGARAYHPEKGEGYDVFLSMWERRIQGIHAYTPAETNETTTV